MQYFGRAIGSVSKTWSSINPATLSGAIDVIVVEGPEGNLACSPFHVRFGKFQILKPSQKKIDVIVNGKPTNIPMKLGESGEAFFVFETAINGSEDIPEDLLASPVISASSSPSQSPISMSLDQPGMEEPDYLNIGDANNNSVEQSERKNNFAGNDDKNDENTKVHGATSKEMGSLVPLVVPTVSRSRRPSGIPESLTKRLTKISIPSKIDNDGNLLLDMAGYKPNKEMVHDTDEQLTQLLQEELGPEHDITQYITRDANGNICIRNPNEESPISSSQGKSPVPSEGNITDENMDNTLESVDQGSIGSPSLQSSDTTPEKLYTAIDTMRSNGSQGQGISEEKANDTRYIKTLRLTSEQLKCLDLVYGQNDLKFSIDRGKAVVTSKLFVWRWDAPIVISDIDGTITKSDALGHVLAMIGRDWTHLGVAKLFSEIARNGYNIMYLTARSAGQADSTRTYLRSIEQNGTRLPVGPVILSPDRTMAALRREVILKKPEVFKIACLNDIRSLYFEGRGGVRASSSIEDADEKPTPFFAGFGNRITDALSYRAVGVPSSRIFTINTEGEVNMELLELAGYKSSYLHINELVDHFFPPVFNRHDDEVRSITSLSPGSPRSVHGYASEASVQMDGWGEPEREIADRSLFLLNQHKFTDVYFWREPILALDDESDSDAVPGSPDNNSATLGSRDRPNATADTKSRVGESASTETTHHGPFYADAQSRPTTSSASPSTSPGQQLYLRLGSPLRSSEPLDALQTQFQSHTLRSGAGTGTDAPVHSNASSENTSVISSGILPQDDSLSDDEFDEDDFV